MLAGCSSESSGGSDPAENNPGAYSGGSGNETGQKDDGGSGSDTGGVIPQKRQGTELQPQLKKLHRP